jgi:hypothetical protein
MIVYKLRIRKQYSERFQDIKQDNKQRLRRKRKEK